MKKSIITLVVTFLFLTINAQQIDYNSSNDYIANGYDVVAYFSHKSEKGHSDYSTKYDGIFFKFRNQVNLDAFNKNPERFIPQYGGWCAYAMGNEGEKVSINPKTFEIRNGKLYLFYNAYFTNTLDDWLEEGAEELRKKADKNWKSLKFKN
jgi:YHS domain-containing protein